MTDESKDPAQALARMMTAGQEQMQRMAAAWAGETPTKSAAPAAASWSDVLKRTHVAYAGLLEESVDKAAVDEGTKDSARFGMRQFIDAMNPANFLMTNPEALELARQTNGQSLVDGMRLFLEDLAKGRISTTDEDAFEVGASLATTPGAVVFENELMQLIQYAPPSAEVAKRPLLFVPPCINKFYILDLKPENSFVRYALERGHAVYMVSWRSATPAIAGLTWDDYVEKGVIQAIDVALDISGADRINTLGFCMGGTLLACALGVMAARGESKAASLTLLTTLLDFSEVGELGTLLSDQAIAVKEATIGKGGILEGKELAFAFSSLRANDLVWQYVSNSYLKGKAPPAFDMLFWNADSSNLPGPMFCWYLRNAYLENRLARPAGTVQCGVPVDLAQVHVPAFVYASRDDHIVPWKTAFASRKVLSGDTVCVLGASGHIAGVINPASKNRRSYWSDGARDRDADHWLAMAQETPGSWWPRWASWLAQHAGAAVPAPAELGNSRYPTLEPAPGRYVMQKG